MICNECSRVNPPHCLTCEKCHAHLYQAKLRVSLQDGESHTHYLLPQNYRIGRDEDNHIVISDPSVSREHVEIIYSDGGFSIQDKNSKNGSLLNSRHFENSKLHNMDCIQLGEVALHFWDENSREENRGLQTVEFVQKEFFRFSEEPNAKIATSDILQTMLDLAISLIHADAGWIFLNQESGELKLRVSMGTTGLNPADILAADFELMQEAVTSEKIMNAAGKLALPLIAFESDQGKNEALRQKSPGVCFFKIPTKDVSLPLSKEKLLSVLMKQIALALQSELLYNEAVEKRKIKVELSLAKEIQQRLLPTEFPDITKFDIASFVRPCEEISGDYFDVIQVSERSVVLTIGDVCGKGVPAGLLSSTVQAAIRSNLEYTTSSKQIVQNLNRLLIQNTASAIFLTLFLGILDTQSNKLQYINAGHPPPFLISGNRIEELRGTTHALGILETDFSQEKCVQFEPGDTMVMYTDGIFEAQNSEKERYTRKRLTNLINSFMNERPQNNELHSTIDIIKDDVANFIGDAKQTDDLTLLALRRK